MRTLTRARSDAARRLTANTWPILQAALAATAAWVIARDLVDHRQPFFAPIAAVVSLNAARGERGSNAVRLVLGVIVGILVGELAITINGRGYGSLGVATLVAMIAALAISGDRLVIAQGAAGAILTVATSSGSGGLGRLVDALIGAGIALVLSQLLFPAEPIALLRRAEAAATIELAEGLHLAASGLARADRALAARAVDRLREMPEGPSTGELADAIGDLAVSLRKVADALGDHGARQEMADRAMEIARRAASREFAAAENGAAFAWMSLRTAAADVMLFVGVDPASSRAR